SGTDGTALRRLAGASAQSGGYFQPALHCAAAAARAASRLRKAAGGGGAPARCGAFRQRGEPSQAFLVRGIEFGHGGFYGSRAHADRRVVPVSPQVAAQPAAQLVPGVVAGRTERTDDDDPDSAAGGQPGSQPRTAHTGSGLPAARWRGGGAAGAGDGRYRPGAVGRRARRRSLPADLQPPDLGGKGKGVNMREYVRLQTGILLRRLVAQANRTARTGDAEAIHDLR